MFTSLQTLRTHSLLFRYDVANALSHTEHVKRSLETSKTGKKAKSADFFSRSEPITVTEGERGGDMRTGMRSKNFVCPKCSPVHENRAKVIISPTCFATFREISLFRFCFCDCFFRGGPRGPFSMGLAKSQIWRYYINKTTKPA